MILKKSIGFFLISLLVGCASYQNQLSEPLRHIKNDEPELAAELLKEPAFTESKDQLAYLLDYSLAEHQAENYEASNKGFMLAYDLSDWNDYHSVSKIGASLLLNEGMVQYKGEEYEKILISIYSAINFLILEEYESARVEVRRIHERINNLEFEGEKVFQEMPFAYYLSALIWEQNGNLDSAYIDYKNTYKYAPNFLEVKKDLLRLSKKLKRWDDYNRFKKDFSNIEEPKVGKNDGQIVMIYQQGRGPIKAPHPNWPRIPKVYPQNNRAVQAKVKVADQKSVQTTTVLDIDTLAVNTMEKQYAGLIAKRAAGLVLKAEVSKKLEQESAGLGQLAWIAMNIADRADLRQWLFLPASIQVAKVFLPKGEYEIQVEALDSSRSSIGSDKSFSVEVKPQRATFINWRSFQ